MPTYRYQITPDVVGQNRTVNIANLACLLQRAATRHSTELGYSPGWYRENETAWVARTHRINYSRRLDPDQPVLVDTTIEDCRRVRSLRSYSVTQPNTEETLASGYTDWVYLNRDTGSITRIPEEMAETFDPTYPDGSPNRQSFESHEVPNNAYSRDYRVQYRDLDDQDHVNNTVYFDYLLDVLTHWRLDNLTREADRLSDDQFHVTNLSIKYLDQIRWDESFEGIVFDLDKGNQNSFGFAFLGDDEKITEGYGTWEESFDHC
jgi:medium-chain acyl-[acyl-carrier-protein] hydrolase